MINGDILTEIKYHHIINLWLNIVQDAKLQKICCQSLITDILIYVGAAIQSAAKSIEVRQKGGTKPTRRFLPIKKEMLRKLKRVKQFFNLKDLMHVQDVIKKVMLMVTMKTTQNLLMLSGYVVNVMLMRIENNGIV